MIKENLKKPLFFTAMISFSGGLSMGSFFDGVFLTIYNHPYRIPFDEIICLAFLTAAIILWILYIIYIVKRRISAEDKMAVLFLSFFITLILAPAIAYLWQIAIETVHDFKRAVGLSHS